MVLNTRLLGAILLAIVIAAAMVARIPVTTMQQRLCSKLPRLTSTVLGLFSHKTKGTSVATIMAT
jgi:hypothetical protein